jgi:hypothetical protein
LKPKQTFVDGFDADVFISYARLDDKPVLGDEHGWVSQLHNELVEHLPEYLGSDALVWRDREEIRNNEDFEQKICRHLRKTATFIAILSEGYFNREWCLREVREFAEHAEKRFGIHVDGEKKRIFKVEKMPIDIDALPDPLQGTTSYRFFAEGNRILRPTIKEYRDKYLLQVEDLLKDLATVLKVLAKHADGEEGTAATSPMTVYVAETTSDLDAQAAEIRRDLKERGYRVLPAGELRRRVGPFRDEVRESLAQSALSVHLVGAEYGFVPEGEVMKSSLWLQHDLAMARGKQANFSRVIWIANGGAAPDERQRKFVEYLEQDSDSQEGAELLKNCSMEDLKTELYDQLNRIRAAEAKQMHSARSQRHDNSEAPTQPTADEAPIIYVMCDKSDRKSPALAALRKYLLSEGFEPVLPSEDDTGHGSDEKSPSEEHIENLQTCDACIIFYGKAPPRWFHQKLGHLRKYLRGRAKPILAKAVYDAPPEGAGNERDVETNEAMVLSGAAEFAPDQLKPFIDRIRQAVVRSC